MAGDNGGDGDNGDKNGDNGEYRIIMKMKGAARIDVIKQRSINVVMAAACARHQYQSTAARGMRQPVAAARAAKRYPHSGLMKSAAARGGSGAQHQDSWRRRQRENLSARHLSYRDGGGGGGIIVNVSENRDYVARGGVAAYRRGGDNK